MNRRNFLASMIAAATLDPERIIWKPGKLISIPAAPKAGAMLYGADFGFGDSTVFSLSIDLDGAGVIQCGDRSYNFDTHGRRQRITIPADNLMYPVTLRSVNIKVENPRQSFKLYSSELLT